LFQGFTFSKYTFYLTALENMLLPTNKASMLRGGFGNIFKKLNCINKISKICKDCPIKETCAYSYIFETAEYSQKIRPYIIEVPFNDKRSYKKNEIISFTIVLLCNATKYLPHFIFTFMELGKKGLTKKKYKFNLEQVIDSNNNIIFKDNKIINKGKISNWDEIIKESKINIKDKLTLNFTTPLRLATNNKLQSKISFELIIKKLIKRINDIYKYHCNIHNKINSKAIIKKAKDIEISFSNLKWKDWIRYSNRQKRKMTFGGLLGHITFKGSFEEFLPYLVLGSYIHIGKNCTFGQGKYEII
jgi:hypothetical protein